MYHNYVLIRVLEGVGTRYMNNTKGASYGRL